MALLQPQHRPAARATLLRTLRLAPDADEGEMLLAIGFLLDGHGLNALEDGFALEFTMATSAGRVNPVDRNKWRRLWRWNPACVRAGFRGEWPQAFHRFSPRPQET